MRIFRRRPAPDPRQEADRRLADRHDEDAARLDTAREDLRRALRSHGDQHAVRRRCTAVTAAYDDAVESAAARLRLATGPMEDRSLIETHAIARRPEVRAAQQVLDGLRIQRQQHVLDAGPLCGPSYVSPGDAYARDAVGPTWPETDYLPEREIYRTKTLLAPLS